jgi:hypothetical protein
MELAVVAVPPKRVLLRLEMPQQMGDLISNFRPDVEADQISVSRAMAPSDKTLEDYVGKTIKVIGVVINMAAFENREGSGEVVEKPYASIVTDDGSVVGTTGKACMGQLSYFVGCNKNGPADPPWEYEVRSHPMPKPKQPYYSLRRVLPADFGKKKGGGSADKKTA